MESLIPSVSDREGSRESIRGTGQIRWQSFHAGDLLGEAEIAEIEDSSAPLIRRLASPAVPFMGHMQFPYAIVVSSKRAFDPPAVDSTELRQSIDQRQHAFCIGIERGADGIKVEPGIDRCRAHLGVIQGAANERQARTASRQPGP
jgi:hypothetical protein